MLVSREEIDVGAITEAVFMISSRVTAIAKTRKAMSSMEKITKDLGQNNKCVGTYRKGVFCYRGFEFQLVCDSPPFFLE